MTSGGLLQCKKNVFPRIASCNRVDIGIQLYSAQKEKIKDLLNPLLFSIVSFTHVVLFVWRDKEGGLERIVALHFLRTFQVVSLPSVSPPSGLSPSVTSLVAWLHSPIQNQKVIPFGSWHISCLLTPYVPIFLSQPSTTLGFGKVWKHAVVIPDCFLQC